MEVSRTPSRVLVHLDASRYARALGALNRAHRLWHVLDAAAIDARCADSENPALRQLWETLADLDRLLDKAQRMLTMRHG